MNKLLSLLIIGLALLAISCTSTTNSTTNPDITGNWATTVSLTGGSATITLLNIKDALGVIEGSGNIVGTSSLVGQFNQSISAITGTYSYPSVTLNFMTIGKYTGSMCSCGQLFSGTLDSINLGSVTIPSQTATFNKQ